jgi:hypothetical protein
MRHCFAIREPGGLFGETGSIVAGAMFTVPCNRSFNQDASELARLVRLPSCQVPLSRFLNWSLRWMRANTTIPFILSYADTAQDHHGGIYQATNWVYVGERTEACPAFLLPDGSKKHSRQVVRELGSRSISFVKERRPDWRPVVGKPKHLYIFPLRSKWATIARRHGWTAKSYPKSHAAGLLDERGSPASEPGANPGGCSNLQVVA